MFVRFWGTRGSLAKPGPSTIRYGGNTSCVEVRSHDGTLIVLDCGTGAHGLGEALLAEAKGQPIRGHLFITHTHWDHIQGFPFFLPLFAASGEWDVYAPAGFGLRLQETLAGQMQYTYFPVDLRQLGATIRYHDLTEQSFDINHLHITTRFLNHPALTLGYRIEDNGVALVYATDHEPHGQLMTGLPEPAPAPGAVPVAPAAPAAGGPPSLPSAPDPHGQLTHLEDQRHAEFAQGADLLIHDAQFTSEEYPRRVGYGHSTIEYVVDVAKAARVRRLALFHHDIARTDDALDVVVARARQRASTFRRPIEVFAAAEGQALDLQPRSATGQSMSRTDMSPVIVRSIPARPTILYLTADDSTKRLAENALATEGFNLLASEAKSIVEAAHVLRPALVFLDFAATDPVVLDLCSKLRTAEGGHLPIMVVGPPADREALAALFAAGATDYLTKPFSVAYLRTRGRAWLMRTRGRWTPPKAAVSDIGRVRAVRDLGPMDTSPDERFDRITRLAGKLFDAPFALFGFVDSDREWLKSQYGALPLDSTKDAGLLSPAVLESDALVVADLETDERFSAHPAVVNGARLRFYAGHPVRGPSGHVVGTLCVLDKKPRHLSEAEIQTLRDLAHVAEDELRVGRNTSPATTTEPS
jgi:ribonuclease BN (tRNA processing enzyme)/CheY-like chemotaxis protein